LQIKAKIVSCHTADSKPVKQEVNSTVMLPHLVFPGAAMSLLGGIFTDVLQQNVASVNASLMTKKKV
jgi:hypothetical protein